MANYYSNPESEWCVLVDFTKQNAEPNGDIPFMPFHIEPIERFFNDPPNPRWRLYKRNLSACGAWDWLTSSEARSILDDIAIVHVKHKSKVDLAVRFNVMKRDNYRCQICGRSANDGAVLEIDHKVPRAKGGKNNIDNLWTLCFDCNRGKRDKDL